MVEFEMSGLEIKNIMKTLTLRIMYSEVFLNVYVIAVIGYNL